MNFGGFRDGLDVIEFRMRFSNTVHNHLSFATRETLPESFAVLPWKLITGWIFHRANQLLASTTVMAIHVVCTFMWTRHGSPPVKLYQRNTVLKYSMKVSNLSSFRVRMTFSIFWQL